jgi:hypothetical protein
MLQNKVSTIPGQGPAVTVASGQLVLVRNSSRVCQQHARHQRLAVCHVLPGKMARRQCLRCIHFIMLATANAWCCT